MGFESSVPLDMLYANGVVNFNPNAYIAGVPSLPLDAPLMASPFYGYMPPYGYPTPTSDSFVYNAHNSHKNNSSSVNKTGLAVLLGGIALVLGLEFKNKIKKYIPGTKKYKKRINQANEKINGNNNKVNNAVKETKGFFGKCWNKVAEKIPGTIAYETRKEAEKAAKLKKARLGTLKKIGKYGGIGVLSVAGLFIGLKILGRIFGRRTSHNVQAQYSPNEAAMYQYSPNLTTPGSQTPVPLEAQYAGQQPIQYEQPAQVAAVPQASYEQTAQVPAAPSIQQSQTFEPVDVTPQIETPQSVVIEQPAAEQVSQPEIQPQSVSTEVPPPTGIQPKPPLVENV